MILTLTPLTTSDLILAITGLVVIIYTIFTWGLWRESVKQTFLQNTPIPAIYWRPRDGKDYIRMRNIGEKPMINIEIEDWYITFYSKKNTEKYCFKFSIPLPNIIVKDEEIDIKVDEYCNGVQVHNSGLSPLVNPNFSPFLTTVKVLFNDITGKKYFCRFLFGKGKFKLTGPIQKWSIPNAIYFKIKDISIPIKEPLLKRWYIYKDEKFYQEKEKNEKLRAAK